MKRHIIPTRRPSIPLILLEIFAGMGAAAVVIYFIVENFNV